MKKTIIMLMSVLSLATGCKNEIIEPEAEPDKILVKPDKAELTCNGGKPEVIVESNGVWILKATEEYSWVTPSVTEGQNGDKVVFDVEENPTLEERKAEYIFTSGTATATFTIICEKSDPVTGEISIYPESPIVVESDGEDKTVMVSCENSNGNTSWTLIAPEEEHGWVSPNITEGKDGDNVTFKVEPNTGKTDLEATFIFKTEADECECVVISKAKVWTLELATEAELTFENKGETEGGQDFTVTVNTNIPGDNLKAYIPDNVSWIEYISFNQNDETVDFFFTVKDNVAYEGREANITIGTEDVTPVSVKIMQKQTDVLTTEDLEINLPLEGGDFEIPLTCNIDYTIDMSDASDITHRGKDGNAEKFNASSVSAKTTRTITFTPVSSSVKPLKVTVIRKKPALINAVANMRDNYAFPDWKNPDVVNNLSQFTIEMLVNINEFKPGNEISTLLGIEGKFLLRMGDGESKGNNEIQLVHNGTRTQLGTLVTIMHRNKWLHFAFTFDKGKVRFYVNGLEMTEYPVNTGMEYVDFGIKRNPWGEDERERYFWIGYSYSEGRDFWGCMSEVRIWNKILTTSEFQAKDHKYYVEPTSEGLVSYWKFNEDDKTTVKDWTGNGNDLTTKLPLEHVEVSLP